MELGSLYGDGYGSGSGSGYGYGYGSGSGSGYGYGYSYGYGYGNILLNINKEYAWIAYHYIKKSGKDFLLRNGKSIKSKEILFEKEISLCEYGFHSSLSIGDARRYKPDNSVLTKVRVWGDIKISDDKLVSQYRQIIEVINE